MTHISRQATNRLRADAHRRIPRRDTQILLTGREIDRWTADLESRLIGIVAANRGGMEGVLAATDVVLSGALQAAADIEEAGLRRMWEWGWLDVTESWVASLPLGYWLQRLVPVKMTTAVDESIGIDDRGELEIENQWQRILDGLTTEAEAREIVRLAEFGSPSPEEIDAIIQATSATDGLSAMERIKTVGAADIGQLRRSVRVALSGEIEGVSAVEALSKAIKPILSENEGLNFKAKRIARTEGVRVAEVAMRASWQPLGDMLKGIRAWTAGDSRVRSEHGTQTTDWHDKLFLRTSAGFVALDGKRLPEFPAGPNCRCYTNQELIDDLTVGLPEPVFRDSRSTANAV